MSEERDRSLWGCREGFRPKSLEDIIGLKDGSPEWGGSELVGENNQRNKTPLPPP